MRIILKNLISLLICCCICGFCMAQDNLNRVDKNGKKQGSCPMATKKFPFRYRTRRGEQMCRKPLRDPCDR